MDERPSPFQQDPRQILLPGVQLRPSAPKAEHPADPNPNDRSTVDDSGSPAPSTGSFRGGKSSDRTPTRGDPPDRLQLQRDELQARHQLRDAAHRVELAGMLAPESRRLLLAVSDLLRFCGDNLGRLGADELRFARVETLELLIALEEAIGEGEE